MLSKKVKIRKESANEVKNGTKLYKSMYFLSIYIHMMFTRCQDILKVPVKEIVLAASFQYH